MPPRAILVLTGAARSGNTASLRHLAPTMLTAVTLHHVDSVGVPDREEMVRRFDSAEAWQEAGPRAGHLSALVERCSP